MPGKRLRSHLGTDSGFAVLTELTGGPGYNFGPIESFLTQARSSGRMELPPGFDFVGIALPQSPGGVANIDPTDVIAKLTAKNLLDGLDIIPHITCKDHNLNALKSALVGYRAQGIETVLALTGDKPVDARGVFELESVGLLDLIQQMNRASLLKAQPEQWDTVPQFLAGAAVSPFKYTEASQMQQYYKMEKKIDRGAGFLITQLGWDWRKSQELMFYLRERDIAIPVIGNVYLLTTKTPAPRLMHTGKLPGCYVSDDLYKKLQAETFEEHVERAAQQVAMYRDLGAAGVDVGGLPDYETLVTILHRAYAIGTDWVAYKDNLQWPRPEGFYLYDEQGQAVALSSPRRPLRQKSFNFFHNHFFTPDRVGTRMARGMVRLMHADHENSAGRKTLTAMEKSLKYLAFKCEDCGDCYLPENFGYCTLGSCEKGLNNAPCGDSTVDGCCGNNAESRCTGELIYEAAAAEPGGRERLRNAVHATRNPALQNSPSWVNFLCGRDHTARNPLRIVGEGINAERPATQTALRMLAERGDGAWTQPSGPVNYLKALIQSQTDAGADYVAVRLDAPDHDDRQAPNEIESCVALVRRWGRGVPICIDGQSHGLVEAGLRAWFAGNAAVHPPLVRWMGTGPLESVLQLKGKFNFSLCVPVVTPETASGTPCLSWIEEQHDRAYQVYRQAVKDHGFQPSEIVFESPVTPLAADLPAEPNAPGHTHIAFETLKRIKQDKRLKGVACALEVGPAANGLPRAIGVCRAYIAQAMEHGLDTCWADAQPQYGRVPADPQIVSLVEAFAQMDGSPEKRQQAVVSLEKFRPAGKKPGPAPQKPASPNIVPIVSKPAAAKTSRDTAKV